MRKLLTGAPGSAMWLWVLAAGLGAIDALAASALKPEAVPAFSAVVGLCLAMALWARHESRRGAL